MLCENLEKRQYYFEIRADEQKGAAVVTGQPIVYESKTDLYYFDEVIEKGALDHTDLKDVVFLVNHDMAKIPLARAKAGSDHSTILVSIFDVYECFDIAFSLGNAGKARISKIRTVFHTQYEKNFHVIGSDQKGTFYRSASGYRKQHRGKKFIFCHKKRGHYRNVLFV